MEIQEIKTLIEDQGKAFHAFQETHEKSQKEKDGLLEEKLSKIEASLDTAVEAKAEIDAKFEAEKKEREDLEARLQRANISGDGEDAKAKLELKEFNDLLTSLHAERKQKFDPISSEHYEDYKTAFDSFMRKNERILSAEQVKTLSVGSDPDGGYFVPTDTNGRMTKKIYETSPMYQIASVQNISTDKLEGIEDLDEAGAGYAGETSQSGDTTTPQVGKWSIPVYWIDTEPKTTQQLLDDSSVNVESWLSDKVGSKFGRFQNAEFVAGATGKIRGLTSYDTAADSGSGVTWGSVGYVATGTSGAFPSSNPADKIHDLIGLLKNDYLVNARFLSKRNTITTIRKFKDGNGNYLWQPSFVMGVPETIMGYPVTRAEDMPTIAANSMSLAFGDFKEGYQIVTRMGIRVLRDPYTSKPYVKFYTTTRAGGGVVNFEAFKFLKFGTS